MKILGIDPGTRLVGYGVIKVKGTSMSPLVGGVLRTNPADPLHRKLHTIFENVREVIQRSGPDIIAVEEVFYGKNVSSLVKIGEARGAILAACASEGREVVGYTPAQVKKAITGNGRAQKSQVRAMVEVFLGKGLKLETDDVSDALAIAICHAHRHRFESMGIL